MGRHNNRVCSCCGKVGCRNSLDICSECYIETFHLRTEINRTINLDLPSTLTLQEWIKTLCHYEWLCAYCGEPLFNEHGTPTTVIDHFIPVALGGGTTSHNCIPACKTCNRRKWDRHPLDFGTKFFREHKENILKVKVYLDTRKNSC